MNRITFFKDMNQILISAQNVIARASRGENGLSTGFNKLDLYTGKLQAGELTILAGRPGTGKSTCLLQMAINIAQQNQPVLLVSYEVSRAEIGLNILSNYSRINSLIFRTRELKDTDKAKIKEIVNRIKNLPLYVIDENSVDMVKIDETISILKPAILMVDYLDIMPDITRSADKKDSIGYITKGLLDIAKKHKIPVIVVTSMNREADKRAIVNFKLSDLKDSSSKEYDAHKVIFVWSEENKLFLEVKKNRNGPSGISVPLTYLPQYHQVTDVNSKPQEAKSEN